MTRPKLIIRGLCLHLLLCLLGVQVQVWGQSSSEEIKRPEDAIAPVLTHTKAASQKGVMQAVDNIHEIRAEIVGATPPNNAVVPVLGPPNHAVVPVSGPSNNAVVNAAQQPGAAASPGTPSSASSCNSCQCICPDSFAMMVNQAAMMPVNIAQNSVEGAATSHNMSSIDSLPASTTLNAQAATTSLKSTLSLNPSLTSIPDSSLYSSASVPTSILTDSVPLTTSIMTMTASSVSSSQQSLTSPSAKPTVTQTNIIATPLTSTERAVTAGGAPIPIVMDYSTFKFESAVTVPLRRIRRAMATAALGQASP